MYCLKLFLILVLSFSNLSIHQYSCTSSILINQETLEILEGKNIHQIQSVASISKIMTAIIVLENCDVFEIVKVDKSVKQAYGSAIYLEPNQEISIIDLLYGLLLRSGNDAALVLSQLIDNFIDKMNEKAQDLGMTHTIFRNTSGLDQEDGGNESCVYDMAILMAYAMNNELFKQIVSTKQYERLDGKGIWYNKNKLLNYEYCIGGKTGYTKKAGRTLVTCASNGLFKLICVSFRCSDDFSYHQSLYEIYFKKYEYFFDLDTF